MYIIESKFVCACTGAGYGGGLEKGLCWREGRTNDGIVIWTHNTWNYCVMNNFINHGVKWDGAREAVKSWVKLAVLVTEGYIIEFWVNQKYIVYIIQEVCMTG